jgi:predicted RNA-binding protein with PIN domain
MPDLLKSSYQRLILSHLEERTHSGKLTGSPITDMKITLISGKAHPKHTDGGDFREATFRALHQALRKSESVLLEPTFDFTIKLPSTLVGRAMTDINNMHGYSDPPIFDKDTATLTGYAPVYKMRSYPAELRAYTHGEGSITMTVGDYIPCHNRDDVIAEKRYNPDLDDSAIADSIFCKGGAGYTVPWYESDEKMHTEPPYEKASGESDSDNKIRIGKASSYHQTLEEDKELMRIFEATYGKIKRRTVSEKKENAAKAPEQKRPKKQKHGDDYLIIDGYNLIHSSDELSSLARDDLAFARDTLIRLLCNYRGFVKCNLTVVFDAYRREDNDGSVEICGDVTVVYTKEKQTADAYIEKMAYDLAEKNTVRVVTSDYDMQLMILGSGALRVSSKEFISEMESVCLDIKNIIEK